MFQLLKKYNKYILAVGGTLLLIVFLIPQAITEFSRRGGITSATVATVGPDNEKVTAAVWNESQLEAEIARTMGLQVPLLGRLVESGDPNADDRWFLLTREAEILGLVGAPVAGGVSKDDGLALAGRYGTSPEFVHQTFAKANAIGNLVRTYLTSAAFSDRRLRQYARRMFQGVDGDIAVIVADGSKATHEPSEAEIAEQFEKYADVAPGEGDMGFGYRLPDRAKVEWLVIDAVSVRSAVEAGDQMDGVALRKHWRKNPDGLFPPADPQAEVPEIVRANLLDALVSQEMDAIERFASNELRDPQRSLSKSGGYLELPEDWSDRQVKLTDLGERLVDRFGIQPPSYDALDERWLTIEELMDAEPINVVSTDQFGSPMTAPSLISALKEFGGSATVITQGRVALPPLRDAEGNLYIVRVTDTDASRPPTAVAEVEESVIEDLKRLAHFRQLESQLDQIAGEVESKGLLATALAYDTSTQPSLISLSNQQIVQAQMQLGVTPTPFPTPLPIIGQSEETVGAIVDHSLTLDPSTPIEELPLSERLMILPVEDALAVVIFRIDDTVPFTENIYADYVSRGVIQAMFYAQELESSEAIQAAFSFESLAKRHNFERTATDEEEDQQTTAEETASASAG